MIRDIRNLMLGGLIISVVCATCFSYTSAARAQEFSKRFYINGGLGVSRVDPYSPTDTLSISDDSDVGFHLGVGMDLSRMFTVEAYAADLGESQVDFLGAAAGAISYRVVGVSALAYLVNSQSGMAIADDDQDGLFRREGASLYARLGLGYLNNTAERVSYRRDHSGHLAFGLGLEYGFSNGVALRSEIVSSDTDIQYANIGVLKRFGKVNVAPVVAKALPVKSNTEASPKAAVALKELPTQYNYFEFDKATLSVESRAELDSLAASMRTNQANLYIEGHTDWLGSEQYNMNLSVKRSDAVAKYLVEQGIDPDRVKTIGLGETRPISTNETEAGRALNRRTEMKISTP